jgi:hypothetical protein
MSSIGVLLCTVCRYCCAQACMHSCCAPVQLCHACCAAGLLLQQPAMVTTAQHAAALNGDCWSPVLVE